jgi:CubicO group peptidase (beta-lactamase class C family)
MRRAVWCSAIQFKLVVGICLAISTTNAAANAVALEERIDEIMSAFDGENRPGASVLVVKNGDVLFVKGYGEAHLGEGRAVTALTNFRIASVSKAFTAMAIMILKDKGLLTFDDKLRSYIPELPAYAQRITIRHILNHTSGLRDYEDLMPSSQTTQVSDEDVLGLLKTQRSTYFEAGEQYRYNNSGYCLLTLIVKRVSGLSFAKFLEQEIFSPLGMNTSVAYEKGISEVVERAYGYSAAGQGWRMTDQSVTSSTLGDGGVYTNVSEMVHWDRALRPGGLVSAETFAEAVTAGRLNNGQFTNYGFGWLLDSYAGMKRMSHTGGTIGFRTAFQRYTDKKISIVVLTNRAESSPWTLAERIFDVVLQSH